MLNIKRHANKIVPTLLRRSYAQTAQPLVLVEKQANISKVILNRPAAYNSVCRDVINLFTPAIEDAENDPNTKAIFLKGNGKAFCSGGDVKFLLNVLSGKCQGITFRGQIDRVYGQMYRNATLNTPLIPVLDGITMGLGCGLAMYAPFRIITEKTKYAMPETAVGIFCDALCSYYLSRLDGYLGKYLTMTGSIINGEDVLFAGLGTHFVPSSRIQQLEQHMSQQTDFSHENINRIIQEYSVDDSHTPEHYTLHKDNRAIIDRCFKFETAEEIMDALKSDNTEFAANTAKAILKRSPTCTKINAENFNRAPNMSFIDIVKLEYMLWSTIIGLPDFSEGIHSRMVLKQEPKWSPSSIDNVSLDYLRSEVFRDGVQLSLPFKHDPNFTPENHLKYVLPTRKTILEAQNQNNLNGLDETVDWFKNKQNNKFGLRQKIESLV